MGFLGGAAYIRGGGGGGGGVLSVSEYCWLIHRGGGLEETVEDIYELISSEFS